MRILHVVDQINETLHGGSAQVALRLAGAQSALGNQVSIFASDYEAKNQMAPEGVDLLKFHTLCSLDKLRFTPGMYFKDYSRFDIVHLHNYRVLPHIMVCDSFKGPIILQAHGNAAPIAWRRRLKPIHDFVWRKAILNKCSWFIADADMEVDHYLEEGADAKRIVKIPVGINTQEFMQVKPNARNGIKNILYLGRLARMKGVDVLLQAFQLLDSDTRLTIAGPDYMGFENNLRKLAGELNVADRVKFTGPVTGNDKLQLYADADVYVLPSRYEMWGLTFMESLACGTPVILSDVCGAARELPKECGAVVPLDKQELATAISNMINANYAQEYREYRKAWVTRYDWSNIARETLKLYQEALLESCLNLW